MFFPGDVWKTVYHEKFHPFLGVKKSFGSRRIRKFELCKGFDTGE